MITVRPRYDHIEKMTAAILEQAGVLTAPVPVESIVENYGINIHASDLGDVSGLVVRKNGNITIGVNSREGHTRRRFTIAHEFAHALLHRGQEVRFDKDFRVNLRSELSGQGTNVEEVEANFFAACLLMPRKLLANDPMATDIDIEDPKAVIKLTKLSKKYNVSPHAMSIRLGVLSRS